MYLPAAERILRPDAFPDRLIPGRGCILGEASRGLRRDLLEVSAPRHLLAHVRALPLFFPDDCRSTRTLNVSGSCTIYLFWAGVLFLHVAPICMILQTVYTPLHMA